NSNAAASDLTSVQHEIVGARACAALIFLEQMAIAFEWCRARMVPELVALLLWEPLEHRKVNHPEKRKRVRIEQAFLLRDGQPQLTEHFRRRFVSARGHDHQIRKAHA